MVCRDGSLGCLERLTVVQVDLAVGKFSRLYCGLDRLRDSHFGRAWYAKIIEMVHQAVVRWTFVMLMWPFVILSNLNGILHVFTQSLFPRLANVSKAYSSFQGLGHWFEHVSRRKLTVSLRAQWAHALVHILLVQLDWLENRSVIVWLLLGASYHFTTSISTCTLWTSLWELSVACAIFHKMERLHRCSIHIFLGKIEVLYRMSFFFLRLASIYGLRLASFLWVWLVPVHGLRLTL